MSIQYDSKHEKIERKMKEWNILLSPLFLQTAYDGNYYMQAVNKDACMCMFMRAVWAQGYNVWAEFYLVC
jgi:hypothetical protein